MIDNNLFILSSVFLFLGIVHLIQNSEHETKLLIIKYF